MASGYLRTQANQFVDETGTPFSIRGVSWYGMETIARVPDGLHLHSIRAMLERIRNFGFNTVRLPFSTDFLAAGPLPFNAALEINNPGICDLTGRQLLKKIVQTAGEVGLRVIFDRHRMNATIGGGAQESGFWYGPGYSEQRWIEDWVSLADEYRNDPTVIGADLHNEPHDVPDVGSFVTWNQWRTAAQTCGNAILAVNPDWLIILEGVQSQGGNNSYWWGGNLREALAQPVQLSQPGKLVYSPHEYPPRVYYQDWFRVASYPDNLSSYFTAYWGYLYDHGIALLLGEFGSWLTDVDIPLPDRDLAGSALKERQWGEAIVNYLAARPGIGWLWWSWNPDSRDTGGVLQNDLLWENPRVEVLNLLQPILE